MFKKPTVFILGAGVSVPFRFPSGERLLQLISGRYPTNTPDTEVYERLHRITVDIMKSMAARPGEVEMFVSKLHGSNTRSIDTWLSQHPAFMDYGKWAISSIIANAESLSKANTHVEDDWYGWLFRAMQKDTKSLSELLHNQVQFVTFNYDRMLEWKLEQSIHNSYSESVEEKNKVAQHFFGRIIHVHGLLKISDNSLNNFGSLSFGNVFGATTPREKKEQTLRIGIEARKLAEGIRIIGEPGPFGLADAIQARLKQNLEICEKIVLLGFGYDDANLALLPGIAIQAAKLVKTKETWEPGPIDDLKYPVVGTAYGLGNARRADAQIALNNCLRLGSGNLSCVPFCEDFISLRT